MFMIKKTASGVKTLIFSETPASTKLCEDQSLIFRVLPDHARGDRDNLQRKGLGAGQESNAGS